METKWYYSDHGVWRGPVPKSQLWDWVAKGLLHPDTMVIDELGNKFPMNSLTATLTPVAGEMKPVVPAPKAQLRITDPVATTSPAPSTPKRETSVLSRVRTVIFLVIGCFWLVSCWQLHKDPTNHDKQVSEQIWSQLSRAFGQMLH